MNAIQKQEITKFEMVLAKLSDGKLTQPMLAGFAVQFEGETHYVIRLTIFPNNPYYLCKNKGSQDGYTVFAKVVKDTDTNARALGKYFSTMDRYVWLKSMTTTRSPFPSFL